MFGSAGAGPAEETAFVGTALKSGAAGKTGPHFQKTDEISISRSRGMRTGDAVLSAAVSGGKTARIL
jgi:hypothetical protein